jgi:hypothetical protein
LIAHGESITQERIEFTRRIRVYDVLMDVRAMIRTITEYSIETQLEGIA